MASHTNWEFYKEVETKILWVNICTQNLEGVSISINKWWKTRYPAYKIRIVSKKEFELSWLIISIANKDKVVNLALKEET